MQKVLHSSKDKPPGMGKILQLVESLPKAENKPPGMVGALYTGVLLGTIVKQDPGMGDKLTLAQICTRVPRKER